MSNKLLVAALATIGSLILYMVLVHERWTTPADELSMTLSCYSHLEGMEQDHFRRYGRYADLQEILSSSSTSMKRTIGKSCEDGYRFDVVATGLGYSISIMPDEVAQSGRHRSLSLYADETHVVRASYGLPRANKQSTILSEREIRRFMPRT